MMKSRPKWRHVVVALGLIAALAIATPALGLSKNIRKAIKAEVAKQIANAKGPAGTNGTNGTNGAPGTARAYAYIRAGATCTGADPAPCSFDHDKGISAVTRVSTGTYCVTAPGISSGSTPAVVSPESLSSTPSPLVMTDVAGCSGAGFSVFTYAASVPNAVNTVAFTIVIP
jgi:hypothetical protein